MPVWRCPHCATPQPESSRCWVCRRSTTSCATCRYYRRGVAGGLGVCGLDPRHPALTGTEMRACWTAAPVPVDSGVRELVAVGPGRRAGRDDPPGTGAERSPRTFVPVETPVPPAGPAVAGSAHDSPGEPAALRPEAVSAEPRASDAAVARAAGITPAPGTPGRIPGTWWLWGDPDPWPDR